MESLLSAILLKKIKTGTRGVTKRFTWQYLAEGILECIPHEHYVSSMVISVGIHGNETAPIEIVDRIISDLFYEKLYLNVHVLFVFGHPQAMREAKRYLEYDLNRLFCGGWKNAVDAIEAKRAREIEIHTAKFFENSEHAIDRYHYDLHTAIKDSLIQTFALIPFQPRIDNEKLLHALTAAELDGLVFHTRTGKTYTNYTAENFNVASATLELGKVNAFGENDLGSFSAIDTLLRDLLENLELKPRQKPSIQKFVVLEYILKQNNALHFNLDANVINFTQVEKGKVIAFDDKTTYQFFDKTTYLIFINPHIALGLRAGLILEKLAE